MATWFQGPAAEFIRASREGFARGVRILHFLGGTSIDLAGDRAIAQTKMTISQRAKVDDVPCDVVCTGRFYDFLERRAGRWGLVLRQPIYEKDRLDPVDPAAKLTLDPELLARFPEGYRHLAYLQTRIGYEVKRDMPVLGRLEREALDAAVAVVAYGRGLTAYLGAAASMAASWPYTTRPRARSCARLRLPDNATKQFLEPVVDADPVLHRVAERRLVLRRRGLAHLQRGRCLSWFS